MSIDDKSYQWRITQISKPGLREDNKKQCSGNNGNMELTLDMQRYSKYLKYKSLKWT